jgi:hypothetical protein
LCRPLDTPDASGVAVFAPPRRIDTRPVFASTVAVLWIGLLMLPFAFDVGAYAWLSQALVCT